MPQIKEFTATNTLHTDDKGYAAYETLGRRIGGQYDQAANDLRDIGRARADATQMIGRWPFNIIQLEQREAGAGPQSRNRGPGGGGANIGGFGRSGGRGGGGGRGSFEQMSEGAGAFGQLANQYVGGRGNNFATSTPSNRDGYSAQVLKERDRQSQLDYLAQQKSWDAYNKNLGKYNDSILNDAQKSADDGSFLTNNPDTSGLQQQMIQSGDATITDFGIAGVSPDPAPSSSFDWTFGLGSFFSTSSGGGVDDSSETY